jgi:hypothetical protein
VKSFHLTVLARKFPIILELLLGRDFGDLLSLVLNSSFKVRLFFLMRRNLFYFNGGFLILFIPFRYLTKYMYIGGHKVVK